MQYFPINTVPSPAEYATLRGIDFYPRNFQVLPGGASEWIEKVGTGPPAYPARSAQYWRDQAAGMYPRGGAYYVLIVGSMPLQAQAPGMTGDSRKPGVGLLDKVTMSCLGPGVPAFYQTNAAYFQTIPRFEIRWIDFVAAGTMNFPSHPLGMSPVPIGMLLEDEVGPIDFIEDGDTSSNNVDFTRAPSARKYRSTVRSDMAFRVNETDNFEAFFYHDFVAPAAPPASPAASWSTPLSDTEQIAKVEAILSYRGQPFTDKIIAAMLRAAYGR